jgi:hypothetical protein
MRHNEGILPPKFWRVCLLRRGDKFRRRCTLFCKLCEKMCCTQQYWKMPTHNEIHWVHLPLPSACIGYKKRRKTEREVSDRESELDPNKTTARKFSPLSIYFLWAAPPFITLGNMVEAILYNYQPCNICDYVHQVSLPFIWHNKNLA